MSWKEVERMNLGLEIERKLGKIKRLVKDEEKAEEIERIIEEIESLVKKLALDEV